MKKKQTAVDWLITQIKNDHIQKALTRLEWIKIFEQAKEMEKQQMKETWEDGDAFQSPYDSFEEYYNKTYGK